MPSNTPPILPGLDEYCQVLQHAGSKPWDRYKAAHIAGMPMSIGALTAHVPAPIYQAIYDYALDHMDTWREDVIDALDRMCRS